MASHSTPQHQPEPAAPLRRRFQLRNVGPEIERFQDDLLAHLERLHYTKLSRFAVRLAVQEAVANGFNHGHKNLPPETPITVEYTLSPQVLEFTIEDQGPGFTPEAVADPTLDENLEVPRGRGIMLIRAYMSEVSYNAKGNQLRMIYRKPPEAAS